MTLCPHESGLERENGQLKSGVIALVHHMQTKRSAS